MRNDKRFLKLRLILLFIALGGVALIFMVNCAGFEFRESFFLPAGAEEMIPVPAIDPAGNYLLLYKWRSPDLPDVWLYRLETGDLLSAMAMEERGWKILEEEIWRRNR